MGLLDWMFSKKKSPTRNRVVMPPVRRKIRGQDSYTLPSASVIGSDYGSSGGYSSSSDSGGFSGGGDGGGGGGC